MVPPLPVGEIAALPRKALLRQAVVAKTNAPKLLHHGILLVSSLVSQKAQTQQQKQLLAQHTDVYGSIAVLKHDTAIDEGRT